MISLQIPKLRKDFGQIIHNNISKKIIVPSLLASEHARNHYNFNRYFGLVAFASNVIYF